LPSQLTTAADAMKGKVHPRTGHEHPDGEYRYSFTRSLTSALAGGGWGWVVNATTWTLYPRWSARARKISPPYQDSIPRLLAQSLHSVRYPGRGNVAAEGNDHDNLSPQFLWCDVYKHVTARRALRRDDRGGWRGGGQPPLAFGNKDSPSVHPSFHLNALIQFWSCK